MTGKKIILAVAPTGGWGPGRGNPIAPDEIEVDVRSCMQAGAALVHLHARDTRGELTSDLSAFDRTVEALKASGDVLIEASTGGLSDLDAAARALPVNHPQAEMASLNLGSLNFGRQVYRNSLPDIRFWIEKMAAAGVKPSLEIFDTGHLDTALHLIAEGALRPPCNFTFIFDVRWGMQYHPLLLDLLISKVPSGSRWGALFIGSRDFSGHLQAAKKGAAFVRVGFEDSVSYEGKTAANNAELVAAIRRAMEKEGFSIVGPQEARSILLA